MAHFAPTSFAIRHHTAVVVMCFGTLLIGVYCYLALPRESFPDVEVPVIFVTTVLDGAAPTDVEVAVTIPIETELDGIEGMKELRSQSLEGMSLVSVEFLPSVDTQVALQRVRDAVDIASADLPPEADEPVVKEFTFTSIPILIYHLVGGEQVSRSELFDLAEKLEDDLKSISGVLDVEIYGGREREVHVEVDPARLHYYQLRLDQVQAIVRGTNRNVTAGTSESDSSRVVMRVPGEFRDPAEIFSLVIGSTEDGTPIYVRDVATVTYGFEDEESRSRTYDFLDQAGSACIGRYVKPRPSVSLQIQKRQGENIVAVVAEVEKAITSFSLPQEVELIKALDQSKEVALMVSDLENGVLTSLILILIVIFVGLGGRNAVLVALAVPFSMLLSLTVVKLLGLTLNMIVLFSLILALGMLVDNAIVVVENIYRYYALGHSRASAAMHATAEVAWPVIASTATTVGAFFPMVFWPGIVGEFMSYLPKTVIVVLLASLFVAMIINPTLAALVMRLKPGAHAGQDPETQRPNYALVRHYQRLLEFMLDHPWWTITTAALMLVLVLATYGVFGAGVEFFPDMDPDSLTCSITPPEGISLEASDRLAKSLESRIFGAPGSGYDGPVQNLKYASVTVGLEGVGGGSTGAAAMGEENLGPIRIQLELVDREFRTQPSPRTLAELRQRIEGLDARGQRVTQPLFGAEFDVIKPAEGPPTGKPISIDIFGEDLGQMTLVARDLKRLMEDTEGAAKPSDNASTAQPTLEWRVARPRAGVFGLDQSSIGSIIQMSVGGVRTGTFGHGDDEQDIVLRLPKEYRLDTSRLANVHVGTSRGGSVPLTSVASAALVPGPVAINHFNRRRVITASAEVQPGVRADASVREAFQKRAAAYPFPAGITYRFGGAAQEQDDAKAFLLQAFVVAIFIIVTILVLQFNSVAVTGIVMSSVILSLMGVFMGLLVLRAPFGIIMTGIGVISLAGVVVNNAIVLLDAIQRFEAFGNRAYDAIVSACMIRFRPVIMTAATTVLGLVPMALKFNIDFRALDWQYNTRTSQFWQPMALAVIFGLLVATVLTLGVVPCLYLLHRRLDEWMLQHFGFGRIDDEIAEAEEAEAREAVRHGQRLAAEQS